MRGCWRSGPVGLVRHRQTKGADTDRPGLSSHVQRPTLPPTPRSFPNLIGSAIFSASPYLQPIAETYRDALPTRRTVLAANRIRRASIHETSTPRRAHSNRGRPHAGLGRGLTSTPASLPAIPMADLRFSAKPRVVAPMLGGRHHDNCVKAEEACGSDLLFAEDRRCLHERVILTVEAIFVLEVQRSSFVRPSTLSCVRAEGDPSSCRLVYVRSHTYTGALDLSSLFYPPRAADTLRPA